MSAYLVCETLLSRLAALLNSGTFLSTTTFPWATIALSNLGANFIAEDYSERFCIYTAYGLWKWWVVYVILEGCKRDPMSLLNSRKLLWAAAGFA